MARVILENVSKTFRGARKELIPAVEKVSFTAEDQELLVLVGPSGSGKTTLLRLIAGLEAPTAGTISIDATVMNGVEPKDRDVAMVFQNFALYPHLTVYENLAFPLKLRKVPAAETDQRVREAAELLGLVPHFNRLPQTLSGGERQRVAVGRALVRRPKVFLFDEPLSNLDAPMRAQMRREIATLHQQLGATMIYVTHDQVEAMTLGDRGVVLRQGRIQQIGEPLTLYNIPANIFVARFIGAPEMNLFPGRLAENGNRSIFQVVVEGSESITLALPAELTARMPTDFAGELVLGFRPEQISLAKHSPSSATHLPSNAVGARVQVVELIGPEAYLHARVGRQTLMARIAAETVLAPGQEVMLELDLRKAHLFDSATGERLQ